MKTLAAFVKQHPVVTYFVLAYAFSWAMVALYSAGFIFALLALFGPALAAIIVTGLIEGRAGVKALLRHVGIWRVGLRWYVVAIGLPVVIALAALCIHSLLTGTPLVINSGTPLSLLVIIALLVVGEELGWRGFALPHLQARYNGLVASLILGVLWAGWHLANATIPGLQYYLYGFLAFLFFVVAQTVLFTWLFNHTRGSVLLAWIFHAWINISNSLFFVGDQIAQWQFVGAGFAIVAVIVLLVEGSNLARNASATYHELPRAAVQP